MVKVFFPKEATISIDATGDVTLSNSTVIQTAFASATTITGQFKDISLTLPVGDVDIINLLGVTAQDAVNYQNAEIEEKPSGLLEVSGTIIIPGDELMEGEIFGAGTSATTHTTYEPGQSTKTKVALMVLVDDGTDSVAWGFRNAYLTEYNPSFTGADGHLEASVTFKCLPRDAFGPQFED